MTIDELLNALRVRLDRYEVEQDPTVVLDPAALADALALAEAIAGRTGEHAESAAAIGLLHWYRYLLLPEPDDQLDLHEAVAVFRELRGDRPELVPEALLMAFTGAEEATPDKLGPLMAFAAAAEDRAAWTQPALAAMDLLVRHQQSGSPTALDEAIDLLTATVLSDEGRAFHLGTLMVALSLRHMRTGDNRDLNELIAIGHRLLLDRDQSQGPTPSSMMALAHYRRYQLAGDSSDLDYAIELGQRAIATTSPGNPELPGMLSNLGLALRARYERHNDPHDLDEAIDIARTAAHTTPPDHPDQPRYLTNLGLALRARYERHNDPHDLDEAIDIARTAAHTTPPDHPDQPRYLTNLGLALRARYERHNDPHDLDEAIDIARTAAHTTPPDHPDRAGILLNLGGTLLLADETHAAETVHVLREATTTAATPAIRALTATYLGRAAAATGDWALATNAFETAIDAVGLMAGHGFSRTDSEFHLARFAGLASDAAACAVNAGEPLRAVELWEYGRGLLLQRSLDLRTDLTDLTRTAPKLGSRFSALRDELIREYERDIARLGEPLPPATRRDRVRREWADLLAEIRELPGFEGFLDRLPATELLAAAQPGPIVLLNVSMYRSDAIALTPDGVFVIPLPAVDPIEVRRRQADFEMAMSSIWMRPDQRLDEVLEWLWDAVAHPVLDGLGLAGDRDPDQRPPRLWWCPSGLLSFLPLHMAGHHGVKSGRSGTVLDLVISSYTPTVSALIHARRKPTQTIPLRMLAVLVAHAPHMPPLPFAVREVKELLHRFPSEANLLADAEATQDAVVSALAETTMVHFACHGVTDSADPSSSGLVLGDQLLTVRDLAQVRLDGTELAYLSACQTAAPDLLLADEATNLATAFQLAGFRHVVANLWSVPDKVAETISRLFYNALGDSADVAADRVAFALHTTMCRLRDRYPEQPSWLLATIHVGP